MKLLVSSITCFQLLSEFTNHPAKYDKDASRYHQGVYKRKRVDLIASLDSTLSPLFIGQLKNLHKACLVAFKKEMLDSIRGDNYSFADVVSKARQQCESNFASGAKETLIEGTDWSWEDEFELLKEEMEGVGNQCRKDETKKMINNIEVNRNRQPGLVCYHMLTSLPANFQEADFRACGTVYEQAFSEDVGQCSARVQRVIGQG